MEIINVETLIDRRMEDLDFARIYAEEGYVMDVLESLCEWMQNHNISLEELARGMKCSQRYITRVFAGEKQLSMRRVAAMVDVMGGKANFFITPKNGDDDE